MKKPFIYCIFGLLFSLSLSAQNLVVNPSFEGYSLCPPSMSAIQQYLPYASGWKDMAQSPDYFNVCNTAGVGVPTNTVGYQQARTGVAYSGIFKDNFTPSLQGREYIRGSLVCPLDSGTIYEVSYYVSQAEDYENCSNNFGVYFLTSSTYKPPTLSFIGKYHVNSQVMICDTMNWVEVKGTFIADSAYTYFIIGNPINRDSTTFNLPPQGSLNQLQTYYYIDDVSVVPLGAVDDSISGSSSICYQGQQMYMGPQDNDIVSYEWIIPTGLSLLSGQNTYLATLKGDSLGVYTIQLVINRGCIPDTLSKTVSVDSLFYDNLSDTAFCKGSDVVIDASSLGLSYSWFNNTTTASLEIDSAGNYWVEVFDGNCITHYDFVVNEIVYPMALLIGADSVCEGDQISVWISGDSATTSYNWIGTTDLGINSGQNTDSILVEGINANANANASLQLIYLNSCGEDTLSKEIYIASSPIVNLGNDTVLCTGTFITLNAGLGNYIYEWSTTETTPSIQTNQAGTYWVKVSDWNCSSWDSIIITESESIDISLGNDTIICTGENITIGDLNNSNVSYLWSSGENSAQLSISDSGLYWLMGTSLSGCGSDVDSMYLSLEDCNNYIYIPNSFSPNGDGINDIFIPKGIGIEDFSMQIYNRWGQLIFSTHSLDKGWDGKLNGTILMQEVYNYKIFYSLVENDYNHHRISIGHVTLLK